MNKKLYAIIAIILVAVLVTAVGAQIIQSITNPQTGTVNNPQTLINIYYDGENCTDNQTVDWGTLEPGENTIALNVTNISNIDVIIRYYLTNVPPEIIVTWVNNTVLTTTARTIIQDVIVTVSPGAPDGMTLNWDMTVTATPL